MEPGTGRAPRAATRRSPFAPATLASRMASVGLPPHAVAALLASVSRRFNRRRSSRASTSHRSSSIGGIGGGKGNESTRRTLEKGDRGGRKGKNATEGADSGADSGADAGLPPRVTPIPASSADRVGRSVGRVWEVSSTSSAVHRSTPRGLTRAPGGGIEPPTSSLTPSDAPANSGAVFHRARKTGAGVGVSHDAWIERMRRASRRVGAGTREASEWAPHPQSAPHPRPQRHPGERGSDAENEAPWWARAEATAGIGGASPFLDVSTFSLFDSFDSKKKKKKNSFTVRLNGERRPGPNGGKEDKEDIDEEEDEEDAPKPRDGAILVDDGLDEYLAGSDSDVDPDDADDEFLRLGDWNLSGRRRGDWCDLPTDVVAASPWSDRRERSARTSSRPGSKPRNVLRLGDPDPIGSLYSGRSSSHAITAVAVGAGGIAAVGSCHGAFAAWNPRTGVVVRARPGGWGEAVSSAGATNNRHYNPTVGLTALGFTTGSSGNNIGGGDGGIRSGDLAVGGTRGGGVAAWDVKTGACVCASPGSHAGAVTVVQSATSSATSSSGSGHVPSSIDGGSGPGLNVSSSSNLSGETPAGFGAVFGHPALVRLFFFSFFVAIRLTSCIVHRR